MKKLNAIIRVLLAALFLSVPPCGRSDVGPLEVVGTAWTVMDVIIGETKITPAYAVETWHSHYKEFREPLGWRAEITKKLSRSRVTGTYFYYSKYTYSNTVESSDPFPLNSVNKLNMTCRYSTNTFWITLTDTIETHTEFVWLAKVESTGLANPLGPWDVWLKTSGYKARCTNALALKNYYYWAPTSLSQSGGETVSLGTPNCILRYPFYLANDFYK